MERLVLQSYAKVNLTLDVGAKRPSDGYHFIQTVMVPISLADEVELTRDDRLSLACTPDVPGEPAENLAYRAAVLLQRVTGCREGAAIRISKRIPVAGGLAGGSTNGAAALVGLNRLWNLGLTESQLVGLAIQLGSDVPFFVPGRPARVEGIGERLTPLQAPCKLWMVLATPDVPKSTQNVYKLFDELPPDQVVRPDAAAMERALAAGDPHLVAAGLGNVFEQVMLSRHPEIARVKQAMLDAGALGALMSGAGPSVLGLVRDEAHGEALLARLRPLVRTTVLVSTVKPEAMP